MTVNEHRDEQMTRPRRKTRFMYRLDDKETEGR